MTGYDRPNWGKSPYNEQQELSDMEYEAELGRLTELGVDKLKRLGVCADLKIDFRNVFNDIVLTGVEEEFLNQALFYIYQDYPDLRPLLDKHIESVARIATEHELKK